MTPFHPSTTRFAGRALVGSVAALLAVLAPSPSAGAQCQYSVTVWSAAPCTSHPPNSYTGTGLNDLGAWCGYRFMCWEEGDGWLPVYCTPGGMPQVLPIPEGAGEDGAQATAVNNAGIVVGWYRVPPWELERACAWMTDGTVIDLFPIGAADRCYANGVNDSGVIVGVHWIAGGSPESVPFIWEQGRVQFLDPAPFDLGQAGMISDSGFVIGYLGYPTLDAHGFRWRDGVMEILEPLAPSTSAIASGVNDAGVVVGSSRMDFGGSLGVVFTPTIWKGREPAALPILPGYQSAVARRINDAGVIVGFASKPLQTGLPSQVPIVWIGGEVFAIASLLAPGSPPLGTTLTVNGPGQILSGGGPRLATPIGWSPADLNGDCAVNGDDLGVLLSSWGVPDFDPRCDFNADGVVDGDDLGTLLGEWSLPR